MTSYLRSKTLGISIRIILAALLVSLGSVMVLAQVTSGTIFGRVKDSTGAYIANANVTIKSPDIGVQRTVTTNGSGDFVAPNMPPGTYTITISAEGFKSLDTRGIVLSAADKLNAGEFELAIGTTAEKVEVTADAGQLQLQSDSGERSDLVTGKQLNDVALNGRMVLDYMRLIPGVVSDFDGSASTTYGIGAFNVNGTRANTHEYTVDGSSNVDTGDNATTHVTVNPDAIAEMKVLTSNYQAEFGKAGGGQVAVVTKSGSNEFHGNGRFFHRNEGMNANNWFADQANAEQPNSVPIGLYRYNYIGYQVGGPIKKNKLYFFWGQEYYRQLVPTGGLDQFRTPTALERQGDFSQTPFTIYNPSTGKPFPGNKIDPGTLTAAQQQIFTNVSKLLSLYALPNETPSSPTSANYATQLSYASPRREDILRIDYQLNSKNRLYGRWVHNAEQSTSPMETFNLNCDGQLQIAGGCINKAPSWNVSLDWVTTISPTLLNEVSFGPSVTHSSWTGANGNLSVGERTVSIFHCSIPFRPQRRFPTWVSRATIFRTRGLISARIHGTRPTPRSMSLTM